MIELFKNNCLKSTFARALLTVYCLSFFAVFAQGQIKNGGKKIIAAENLTPVVLIHGIGGSDLRRAAPEKERDGKRNLLNDGFPNDVLAGFMGKPQNLQFGADGAPRIDTISKQLTATEFYDVPQSRNITDLSKFLVARGYLKAAGAAATERAATLFEFYYDFRFSVVDTAALLAEFVERVKMQTGAARVDLVGHSMGGVIIKQYLTKSENSANARTIVFAATPHLGAPKALKALRYGDNLDVAIFDECKLKRAVHNMPSMFNLLPGKRYFEASGGGYFTDARDLDKDGAVGELDYERTIFNLRAGVETRCPMKPDKNDAPPFDRLSSDLIRDQVENFRDAQDNWKRPANVKVFVIAGYNVPTLKSIKEDAAQITYSYTTEGDGTVPLWSAETCDADAVYFADFKRLKTDHSQMIGSPEIDSQIYNLLQIGAGIYAANILIVRPDSSQFVTTPKIDRALKPKPKRTPKTVLKTRKK